MSLTALQKSIPNIQTILNEAHFAARTVKKPQPPQFKSLVGKRGKKVIGRITDIIGEKASPYLMDWGKGMIKSYVPGGKEFIDKNESAKNWGWWTDKVSGVASAGADVVDAGATVAGFIPGVSTVAAGAVKAGIAASRKLGDVALGETMKDWVEGGKKVAENERFLQKNLGKGMAGGINTLFGIGTGDDERRRQKKKSVVRRQKEEQVQAYKDKQWKEGLDSVKDIATTYTKYRLSENEKAEIDILGKKAINDFIQFGKNEKWKQSKAGRKAARDLARYKAVHANDDDETPVDDKKFDDLAQYAKRQNGQDYEPDEDDDDPDYEPQDEDDEEEEDEDDDIPSARITGRLPFRIRTRSGTVYGENDVAVKHAPPLPKKKKNEIPLPPPNQNPVPESKPVPTPEPISEAEPGEDTDTVYGPQNNKNKQRVRKRAPAKTEAADGSNTTQADSNFPDFGEYTNNSEADAALYSETPLDRKSRNYTDDERLAVACKSAKPDGTSERFPFSTEQIVSYWNVASAKEEGVPVFPWSKNTKEQQKLRVAVCAELNKKSRTSSSVLSLLKDLMEHRQTLLNWIPEKKDLTNIQNMQPHQYLDYLKKVHGNKPEFNLYMGGAETLQSGCVSDAKSPADLVPILTQNQEFVRHYFTPDTNLPGLLVYHTTGSGKTSTALCMATSSWAFRKTETGRPLKVGWVTTCELKVRGGYSSEIFKTFSYMLYRRLIIDKDRKVVNDKLLQEMLDTGSKPKADRDAFLKRDPLFLEPQSHEQLYNLLNFSARTTSRQEAMFTGCSGISAVENNYIDCVYVIDEAHKFVDGDARYEETMKKIDAARAKFSVPIDCGGPKKVKLTPIKIVALTATPFYNGPLTAFRLLRLVGVQHQLTMFMESDVAKSKLNDSFRTTFKKLPTNESELEAWLTSDRTLSEHALKVLQFAITGLVSYADTATNPRFFTQFYEDTTLLVKLSDIQLQGLERCFASNGEDGKSKKSSARGGQRWSGQQNALLPADYYTQQYALGGSPRRRKTDGRRRGIEQYDSQYEDLQRYADALGQQQMYARTSGDGSAEVHCKKTESPMALKTTKLFDCGQKYENFADPSSVQMADEKGFLDETEEAAARREQIVVEMEYTSPKMNALLHRILELDSDRNLRDGGKLTKHVIYTNTAESAKMIWSYMCADVFKPVQCNAEHTEFKINTKPDNNFYHVAILSHDRHLRLWGHEMTTAEKNEILDIFNSRENVYGAHIRFLIFDMSLSEGVDMLDVKHLHVFEPTARSGQMVDVLLESNNKDFVPMQKIINKQMNERVKELAGSVRSQVEAKRIAKYELESDMDSIFRQVLGRVRRFCGNKHMRYDNKKGWTITITRYVGVFDPVETPMPNYKVDPNSAEKTVFESTFKIDAKELHNMYLMMTLTNLFVNSSVEKALSPQWEAHPKFGLPYPNTRENCIGFQCDYTD